MIKIEKLTAQQESDRLAFFKSAKGCRYVEAYERYASGEECEQIARNMQIASSSVYNYIYKAKRQLTAYIEKKNGSYICKSCVIKLSGEIPLEVKSSKIGKCANCGKSAVLMHKKDAGLQEKTNNGYRTAYTF